MIGGTRPGDRPLANAPRRVSQLRVAEAVAAELRERILAEATDGRFQLPAQEHLMKEFGVSHPSIREAIRILETEGLVTVRRGKRGGAEVHLPDQSSAAYHLGLSLQAGRVTLADLGAGLQMFEPLCAGECARRDDRATEVVPLLRESIDRSAQLIGAQAEFTRAAREFHALVAALTPNTTARYVVNALVALWSAQEATWAEMQTRRGAYPSRTDATEVVRTHRRIVDRIEAGTAAEAEQLARSHLAATQALIVKTLDGAIVNATSTRARQAITATRVWLT